MAKERKYIHENHEGKSCPFCGCTGHIRETPAGRFFIYCSNTVGCGCSTNYGEKETAIGFWEKRNDSEGDKS